MDSRTVTRESLAAAARDFAGYVPFSRLRVGGQESWKRLRSLLDEVQSDWPDGSLPSPAPEPPLTRESLAAAMVETVDVLRGKGTVALLKSEYREWADAILAALPKAAMQELAANEPVLGDRPTGTMGGFSGEPGEMPERLAHETGHSGAAQPAPDLDPKVLAEAMLETSDLGWR